MITLGNKEDIHTLFESESFTKLINLDIQLSSSGINLAKGEYFEEYFENSESEEGPDGIILFNTPQINEADDRSSYLQVVKLYGQPELPFRILGVSIWDEHEGISISTLSDVRTLSDAIDYSLAGHELDTFDHTEIHQRLQDKGGASKDPMALVLHEVATSRARTLQKEKEARLQAPIREADIQEIMSTAKSSGLKLDELPNIDYAHQMNNAFFGGKGEVFILYTPVLQVETGLNGDVAVIGLPDSDGGHRYFDLDGTPKNGDEIMDSYKNHLRTQFLNGPSEAKDAGIDETEFMDVVVQKLSGQELTSMIGDEQNLRGEQYSEAKRIIGNAIHQFATDREAKYHSALARDSSSALDI